MAFTPLHDRVLVKRIAATEKTKGGLIIPESAKEKPAEGEIVSVGAGARKDSGELTGRTRCNRVVNFDAHDRDLLGTVVPMLVTRALPHSLRGEMAGASAPAATQGRVLAAAV